jgi:glycosyltransferase involved in cell wall biosynthesis
MENELFSKTIPAKLQSYMACQMPIVASATGETQKIINEANCGVCSKIGDAHFLADSIIALLEKDNIAELGTNAKMYSDKHFNKKTLMDEMDKYLGE